jgi:hypothetical protein
MLLLVMFAVLIYAGIYLLVRQRAGLREHQA